MYDALVGNREVLHLLIFYALSHNLSLLSIFAPRTGVVQSSWFLPFA